LHQYKGISSTGSSSVLVYAKGKWGLQIGDYVALKGCGGLFWQVDSLKSAVQCTDVRVATLSLIDGAQHTLGENLEWEANNEKSVLLIGTRTKLVSELEAGARKWFGGDWFDMP
jgi:hypothetical protein